MVGFLLTQNEAGLFAVSAAFGLGFSGIIPAYVLAVRELFPASEASWRVPIVLLFSGSGMAFGGWFAGAVYDWAGFYAIAFRRRRLQRGKPRGDRHPRLAPACARERHPGPRRRVTSVISPGQLNRIRRPEMPSPRLV
jgi:hypothetical protein